MSSTPSPLGELLQRHGLASTRFGSIFDIVGSSKAAFLNRYGDEFGERADALYDDALRQAIPLARRFREQRLHGPAPSALVDGRPTYQSLFSEDWRERSPEGSLDANDSAVAYLCALYQWARDADTATDDGSGAAIKLDTRRPDLAGLTLNRVNTDQVIPALTVINDILIEAIETHSTHAVNTALAAARFPFSLPYEFANEQLVRGLKGVDSSTMEVIGQADTTWPYFLDAGLAPGNARNAQQEGSRLSPSQFTLLTETVTPDDTYYFNNFGVSDKATLNTLSVFSAQTGLAVHDVQALLCTQGKDEAYNVVASPNVTSPALTAAPNQYGAVYIHGNSATDSTLMTITAGADADGSTLTHTSDDRFARMNRLIRLRHWCHLPFDQVDLLLTSAMHAEGSTQASALQINANSVRALGVFTELNRSHTVSAETFATWLYQITPYAVGETVPFYDRLFNTDSPFDEPLLCDGQAFDQGTIDRLCAGLDITAAEYLLLSAQISSAQTGLTRSLPVLSAFHRLASLPRVFGLGVAAGLAVLEWLGGNALASLAGTPAMTGTPTTDGSADDVLDIIVAFAACADWLQSHRLPAGDVAFMLYVPESATLVATPAQTALVDGIVHDLDPVLLTVDKLTASGAPVSDNAGNAIDWSTKLASVLDGSGLVIDQADLDGAIDTALAAVDIDAAARDSVKAQLLNADAAQQDVTAKALTRYLATGPDFPPLLLQWAGTSSYTFLKNTLAQDVAGVITLTQDYMQRLFTLSRCQMAVSTFALSAGLVECYVNHPAWFNVTADTDGSLPLTLASVYRLSRYNDALDASTAEESEWLDYLGWVNATTKPAAAAAADRLATLLGWTGDEVKLAATHMAASSGIAATIADIDGVQRLQWQAQKTGLSVDRQTVLASLAPSAAADTLDAAGAAVAAAVQARLAEPGGTTGAAAAA